MVAGLGARGCVLCTRRGLQHFPPVPLDRPVVATNGAGDALAVGFLRSHVLEGRSPEESIHRGQTAARHCCALRATSAGLITAAELDAGTQGL